MQAILDFISSLNPVSDRDLIERLKSIHTLTLVFDKAKNQPQQAQEIWNKWAILKKEHGLNQATNFVSFKWHQPYIEQCLLRLIQQNPYHQYREDPITLSRIQTPIVLRSGHCIEASSLLQCLQFGNRKNLFTQEKFTNSEFRNLITELRQACYQGNIANANNFLTWHLNITQHLSTRDWLTIAAFTIGLTYWGTYCFPKNDALLLSFMALTPIILLGDRLTEKIFGVGIAAFCEMEETDSEDKLSLPLALSVFKVAEQDEPIAASPEVTHLS